MARAAALILAGIVLLQSGCGDPLVVLGDAPGFMRIVAGVGDSIGTRVDSIATRTRLTEPAAIAFDPESGTLYVADRGSVVQSGGITRPVARIFSISSSGRLALLLDGRACATLCLQRARGMIFADGALLIADDVSHRIFRFDIGASLLASLAGTGTLGHAPDGAIAAQSPLAAPVDIARDDDGRIYFAENAGHRIRVLLPDGALGTVAGTGRPGFSGDGASAALADLSSPFGLEAAGGVLYFADEGNHRVRAVDLVTGTIRSVAGSGIPAYGGDGGLATDASLSRPRDVAISADRLSLFVSDHDNHRVRAVNLGTGVIRSFAGTGQPRFGGAGPAGATSLSGPTALHASAIGFLFIADTGHFIIWRTPLTY